MRRTLLELGLIVCIVVSVLAWWTTRVEIQKCQEFLRALQ